ncbi:MAG TPA: beta-ketoacyl-ACP synthase II [Solirubrobacteraceae bacterium]|nr:beta-ketoacyl-ACP synthase II [Solirubrobacteraceae bacterium]
MTRRVVVTGVGAVTPLGVGARTLHERWSAATSGIEDGQGACTEFDPTIAMTSKEARRSDRFSQLAVAACAEALEEAEWDDDGPYPPERVGCVLGTGVGGIETLEANHAKLLEGGPGRVSPLTVPLMMGNAGAATLSMRHKLCGPVYGLVSACAAGAHAIGDAARLVRSGDADAIVAGGSEAALSPLTHAAFTALDALSPTGISRPFDARRDGFVMGEGAAVLVLEEAGQAEARGATVLGEVLGYAATSDAHHITAPDPAGTGAAAAIRGALADASLEAGDVDYVNAHGTSTPLNDRSETEALKAALGERASEIPVSSTKSAIGHLLGAAGAVEAVATLLALRDRIAPPTLGYEEPDEGMDLDYVPDGARPLATDGRPPVAISNAFGFGGHNAVLCFGAAA